jgi:hypothetical protein
MQQIETSSRPGRVPAAGLDFLLREKKLLIRQRNALRVPHPFPRILREWVGNNVTLCLPD